MTPKNHRIAIVFPADAYTLAHTRVEDTRLAGIAQALASAGVQVVSAPFCDAIASDTQARLAGVDLALVWFNPFEAGQDRTRLNAVLRAAAAQGVAVSAHPDVIDKIGTKEVLYQTRHMPWGSDTQRYASMDAMRVGLPEALLRGPRVLKQMRGQSGDGIWKVRFQGNSQDGTSANTALLAVQHAARGSVEQRMALDDFAAVCQPYFAHAGAMIDQAFQPRLNEGMIRCYVVGGQVAGFGEQLVNALYPAGEGQPSSAAPQPGPRLYFSADRPDFQRLKSQLERDWIPQMCQVLGLQIADLPILWDADFLLGTKTSAGQDRYVLCEINASSVYPFPPSALPVLVQEALARCRGR